MKSLALPSTIISFLAGASVSTILAIYLSYKYSSDNKNKLRNHGITSNSLSKYSPARVPPEIKNELYSRIKCFFGPSQFEALQSSFVIIVGLGGVGSHAANMLVRSGVQKIRIIDFDQVTLSSLNRHALATLSDVGYSKAEIIKKRLLEIVSWCEIDAVCEMFRGTDADRLLSGSPHYVLDCIDDVNTKAELIAYCYKNNINIITSTGAGGKADPTKIRIGSLQDCMKDPLASKIKWKLKKYEVDTEAITTVYSIEKPLVNLLPLTDEQKAAPNEFGVVDYLRLRVMPVLGTSPAIFGQAMASYVLCQLAGLKYDPDCCERMSKNQRHRMLQHFRNNETRRFPEQKDTFEIDDDDIEIIIHQIWKGRCAITERRIGGHAPLVIVRWNDSLPPTPYNLVLLVQAEANNLEKIGINSVPVEIQQRIEERLKWAENLCVNNWDSLRDGNNNWKELEKRKEALDIFELLEGSTSKSTFHVNNNNSLDNVTHWWDQISISKVFHLFLKQIHSLP